MANYANQTTRLTAQSIPSFPTQTSFTQLFGDTFAKQPADSLYLLEDLTGIGATLTNNNAVTFPLISDLTIDLVNVSEYDGVDQYLSTPTATANEVGTGSFIASIWFKDDLTQNSEAMFSYGDEDSGEQFYRVFKFSSGEIRAGISDGTTTVNVETSASFAPVVFDNKWHLLTLVVDRNENFMYLLIDGELVQNTNNPNPADISAVTGTLDNVGTNLNFGARAVAAVPQLFWGGQLSNFSLYIADAADNTVPPDYNIPRLVEAGLRETAVSTSGVFLLQADSTNRLNNQFGAVGGSSGTYQTTVINTSEGIYDIISLYETNAGDDLEISIDGEIKQILDLSPAASNNNTQTDSGIYLSAGTHILKTTTRFGIYGLQMIELIKRDGGNEGDNEATSGVIFGDEIIQRNNGTISLITQSAVSFNNTTQSDNQLDIFTEGDIFLKKGNYKITYSYLQATSAGLTNVYFGGVKTHSDIDENIGSTENAVIRFAFLEGGKTTVRVENNGKNAGTEDRFRFNWIRFELVSGKGNGDEVNIWGWDEAFEVQNTLTNGINTSYRFSGFSSITSPQVQDDEYGYRRYFSGGTYLVKWIHITASNQAIADIFLDGNTNNLIYDNVDLYSAGLGTNVESYAIKTISRGFHDIHLKAVSKNASSSAFNITQQHIQFTKIADVYVPFQEDTDPDPVHGALVPLAQTVLQTDQNSFVFLDIGGVDVSKYSALEIYYKGESQAAQEVRLQVNNITTSNYFQNGFRSGTTLVNIDKGATTFFSLTDVLISGANLPFSGKIHFEIIDGGNVGRFLGTNEAGVSADGSTQTHLYNNAVNPWDPNVTLRFSMDTLNFHEFAVSVYGVKR